MLIPNSCKQVPTEFTGGIVRWAHPDGYFLNARGRIVPNDNQNPSSLCVNRKRKSIYPKDRVTNKLMHHLMALTFYGQRPTYTDANGKPYVGIVHHLIPDKLNYRPDNLLCWLTREQHSEADRRQRLLRTVVPDGDLTLFTYERLRDLQDPRNMSRQLFERELEEIKARHFRRDNSQDPMMADMTHRREC